MVIEVSPTSAVAAFVTSISGNADNTIEDTYNESRNFYYDYHSIDVGRAGTLSINDYTLTPSLNFDALGIDGNIFPVNISMRYNSTEYRFLKNVVGLNISAYGNGWCTNYSSTLCELQYEDKLQIAYLTGNGEVILFEQSEFNENDPEVPEGTTKWSPISDSYGDIVLYKATDETAQTNSTLINGVHMQYALFSDNMMYTFDLLGRLAFCKNTDTAASISINYETNSNSIPEAISKITDGVGNEYRFVYTDNRLSKIKCYTADGTEIIAGDGDNSAPLEMNFAYTNGRLTTATFPDGKSVFYKYDPFGNLISVTNIDGYKAELSYRNGNVCKLAEYALDENNEYTAGGYVNISWDGNTRTFTDDTGEVQTKNFDDTGKIISIVDGDGNYLYGESVVEEEYTGEIIPEEVTQEAYVSVCPCENCTEWECNCACESEEICTCIQCKRYSDTVEDESGNVLAEESFDGNRTMKTQNTYTSDGNYLASSVDTSGNIVYYVYDEAGFLDSMTSGDTEVLFDYDAMGNLTKLYQNVRGASHTYNGYGIGTMSNVYTYADDKVTSITHNGFTYNFTYDEWGNQTSVKIGENVYQSYEYDTENSYRLSKINYANGQSITYSYDSNDNITGVSYDNGLTYAYVYEYDNDGNLQKIIDNKTGLVTTYSENAVEIKNTSDNSVVYSSVINENGTETESIHGYDIVYTYDSEYNQTTGQTVTSKSYNKYYYDCTNYWVEYDLTVDLSTTTDWFGRVEKKNTDMSIMSRASENTGPHEDSVLCGVQNYTYDDTETTASTKVKSHSSSYVRNGSEFFSKEEYYEYDETGNITGIYRIEDGKKVYYHQYTYDTAGQMYSEYNYLRDEYIIYLYDFSGNIITKNIYPGCYNGLTHMCDVADVAYEYSYEDEGWGDKLTNYNYFDPYLLKPRVYYPITYDAMGNMTSFNGSTMTWTAGRQLSTLTTAEGELYSFTYNENGFLSKIVKSVDGVTEYTESYTWVEDKMVAYRKQKGYAVTESIVLYDDNNEAYGFLLDRDTVYLYNKNLQGDITEILEPDFGIVGAEYHYDAYGNYICKDPENSYFLENYHSAFVDEANPFTYRGYLDINIGDYHLYYLGSRFYSPQLGRFINADSYVDTGTGVLGTNMFAYCNNNPVMYVDPTGEVGIGALIGGTTATVAIYALAATGIVILALSATGIHVTFAEVLSVAIDYLAGQTRLSGLKIKAYAKIIVATVTATYTANKLTGIAKDYGLYKCKEAAKEMAKYLSKKGIDAKVVKLWFVTNSKYPFVYSDITNNVISENGVHYGVLYNGNIYCNVHPQGLPKNIWINDFHCVSTEKYVTYYNLNAFI